jgi:hypothetical protein
MRRPHATRIVLGSGPCHAALVCALVVACSAGQPAGEGPGVGSDGSAASGDSGSSASDGSDERPILASDASSSADADTAATPPYVGLRQSNVVIGNVFLSQPGGIAFVSNDEAAILMQVGWSGTPGTAAPDGSINKLTFAQDSASISFDWTRTGNAIAARLNTDTPVTFALELIPSWPAFQTTYSGSTDGALVTGSVPQGSACPLVPEGGEDASGECVVAEGGDDLPDGGDAGETAIWTFKASQSSVAGIFVQDPSTLDSAIQAGQPVQEPGATAAAVVFALTPGNEVQIVAGFDGLLPFASVDGVIDEADQAYTARRIAASGDWGDFAGAIADNLNNTRLYSSVTHRVAHTVSRTFNQTDPDYPVFFCWDSFFNGLLSSLEDPVTGRDTVRGILSFQTAEGLVPNFGGWIPADSGDPTAVGNSSPDRSQPPVGAMAVWKMHERWPDLAFLSEVYPKLVLWHDWWPTARDGNQDGLLEWGSDLGSFQNAQYETGWDDNVEYATASMVGNNMNVDAVDLNSLWAMDAEYLVDIATALGKTADATRFQADHDKMASLIDDQLWNDALGIYCSRPWEPVNGEVFLTRLTPMNFYPLIAGVPNAARAASVIDIMTSTQFWGGGPVETDGDAGGDAGVDGDWVLPTVAYDDPAWPGQTYWHGTIWGPVNYLVFQGLKRYATPKLQAEFARRSVNLFMTNWTQQGICGENYLSTTGQLGGNPNYTWGALMNLIGIEAAADFGTNSTPVPGSGFTNTFQLANIPFGGKLYDIQVSGGAATVSNAK